MSTQFIKGGRGSGNFNHSGRPGEVGGSGEGSASHITETAAFKKWFGNSKVVDAKGNPLRAFHGTTKDFNEFITVNNTNKEQRNRAWSGDIGSWFAAESKFQGNYDEENAEYQASVYTEDRQGNQKEGANILPVYLSIQNPMEFQDWEEFADTRGSRTGIAFRESLIAKGHDGIVIRNSDTDGFADRDDWVAFHPEQIKSATGNQGTFDPKNPNITKSLKATPSFGGAVWNPYMRAYVPISGKPVDTSKTRKIVDEVRRLAAGRMSKLANRLKDGDLTNLTEFSLEFKSELKNLFLTTHALARGGIDAMDSSDWGMLGQSLKEQYSYANSMIRDIENGLYGAKDEAGEVIIRDTGIPELGDAFINRVDLYSNSAWGAAGEFENVVRDREMALGSLERRVLGNSKKNCPECIELAERSWQPPSLLPDIGDTECNLGCNCIATGDSKVTTQRGQIPISEIEVGDMVLTHMNRWCRVTATRRLIAEPNRKLYSVPAPTGSIVKCTSDHVWLTDNGWECAEKISQGGSKIKQQV